MAPGRLHYTFPLLVALITGSKGETFNQIAVCLPVGSQFEGMPELFGACRLEAEAWAGNLRELRQWCTDRKRPSPSEWLNEALKTWQVLNGSSLQSHLPQLSLVESLSNTKAWCASWLLSQVALSTLWLQTAFSSFCKSVPTGSQQAV